MKKFLLSDDKRGYTAETRSAYNGRIITYAVKGLEDLSLLAGKLPEEMQSEIFNEETLAPLVQNLFRLIAQQHIEVVDLPEIDREELKKRRKRVLALCHVALDEIGDVFNARNLAPDVMTVLMEAGPSDVFPTITGLKAVYIKALPR